MNGAKVFIGGSGREIKAGKALTEELVNWPIAFLTCFGAVAGAFALCAKTGIIFAAHGAWFRCVGAHQIILPFFFAKGGWQTERKG